MTASLTVPGSGVWDAGSEDAKSTFCRVPDPGPQIPTAKSVFSEGIVRIAIQPALSRFGGRNDGMLSRSNMLGGVAIGR